MDVAFTSLKAARDYINKLNCKEYYFINADVELIDDGAELEEEDKPLKDRLIISNAKHTDYIIETNKKIAKLRKKLKIAEEHLDVIARGYHFGDDIEKHLKLLAQQALQKIDEVTKDEHMD